MPVRTIAVCYLSGASRHYDKDKDAWAVFPKDVGSYVSLYALVDGNAASIYTTGDVTTPVDLGISVGTTIKNAIKTGTKELYTIRLSDGASTFSGQEVYLYDALNKYTHNLSQSAYTFQNTVGDITGRFQLFAKVNPSSTAIGEVASGKQIRIAVDNHRINVESTSGEPIREIKVFNVVGRLLYTTSNLNNSDWSFLLEQGNQVVIVKVETKSSSLTEKILLLE